MAAIDLIDLLTLLIAVFMAGSEIGRGEKK